MGAVLFGGDLRKPGPTARAILVGITGIMALVVDIWNLGSEVPWWVLVLAPGAILYSLWIIVIPRLPERLLLPRLRRRRTRFYALEAQLREDSEAFLQLANDSQEVTKSGLQDLAIQGAAIASAAWAYLNSAGVRVPEPSEWVNQDSLPETLRRAGRMLGALERCCKDRDYASADRVVRAILEAHRAPKVPPAPAP